MRQRQRVARAGKDRAAETILLLLNRGETAVIEDFNAGLRQQFFIKTLEFLRADARPALRIQTADNLLPESSGEEIDSVGERHETGNHCGGAHAARHRMRIQQNDFPSAPRGSNRRRDSGRSGPDHTDFRRVFQRDFKIQIDRFHKKLLSIVVALLQNSSSFRT